MMPDKTHEAIDWEEALSRQDLKHAAHCLLYYTQVTGERREFYALMQVRSDGLVGFPGGHIDEGEEISATGIVGGLNRELVEEMNIGVEDRVPAHHYVCSHRNTHRDLVCHFYHMPMTKDQFERNERQHSTARDFPSESLGLFRIPIYWTVDPDGEKNFRDADNEKFWPVFMDYPFCGNSRDQLLITLMHLGIVNQNFVDLVSANSANTGC